MAVIINKILKFCQGATKFFLVNKKPLALTDTPFTYCPGCGHGIAHRLIAEAIDELGIRERTVAVWPVGCSVFGYEFFNVDSILASHGKAPAVATGVAKALRLTKPDVVVFAYQGDGDLASIGFNEIVHAANRGWGITVIFINNGTYGMTGGQLAPTSLIGQRTATSPAGRDPQEHGYPIPVCEILATLHSPAYIARVALFDAKRILQAKKAIRKAFEVQMSHKGFALVEILSPCPTDWGLTPSESMKRIERDVLPVYPLNVFKDVPEEAGTENILPETQEKLRPERKRAAAAHARSGNSAQWPKNEEVVIAGSGGQGILAAGEFLALSALHAGKQVLWMPSYGPEMRGGKARCWVIFSDEEIASPLVEKPTALFVMNGPSFDAYVPQVRQNGIIVVNSSIIKSAVERTDIRAVFIPATDIADALGDHRVANVVMLGAYAAMRGLDPEELLPGLCEELKGKAKLIALNDEALKRGHAAALNKSS